jgi:hypothetical protein
MYDSGRLYSGATSHPVRSLSELKNAQQGSEQFFHLAIVAHVYLARGMSKTCIEFSLGVIVANSHFS